MKRFLSIATMILATGVLWANGATERSSTLEGTVVSIELMGTEAQVRLQLRDGTEAEVLVPEKELARLQVRLQAEVRVEGVLVTGEAGTATRLYARRVSASGETLAVEAPVTLREQDRLRLKTDSSQTGDQVQTRTRTQTSGSDSSPQKNAGTQGSGR